MIALEQYLIENGWKKYRAIWSKTERKWTLEPEKDGKHVISTMVNIDYHYLKTDSETIPDYNQEPKIIIGLHDYKKPVTLISPICKSWEKKYTDYKITKDDFRGFDYATNRRLAIGDFEQILKEIL